MLKSRKIRLIGIKYEEKEPSFEKKLIFFFSNIMYHKDLEKKEDLKASFVLLGVAPL